MTQEELNILRKNGWNIRKDRLMACNRIIISKNETTITIDKDHSKENSYRVALSSIDGNYTKDGFSYVLECLNVKRENIMKTIRFVLEATKNIENVRKEKYQND